MSLQTGVETPRGPESRRLGDRVRYRWFRVKTEPNALWMREMRQSTRLVRTPIILMVLTVLMALLMAAMGGVLAGNVTPAEAGRALYQVFFSLAFFVVTLVGPAIAANSIAAEREGHTWEAVMMTDLRAAEIARGKFWTAYTSIATYIVVLAPVGAIPFLFGGITPLEVVIAFLWLFLIAAVCVAFGLAISSKTQRLRSALLLTLLASVPLSVLGFGVLGIALSDEINDLWNAVEEGPVWLPSAYVRAPFGRDYALYLLVLPAAAVVFPTWLLLSVTVANLTSANDDRSRGVKWWLVAATTTLTATSVAAVLTSPPDDVAFFAGWSVIVLAGLVLFAAILFAGEPVIASRRVRAQLLTAGRLRRLLSPGISRAAVLQLTVALVAGTIVSIVGLTSIDASGAHRAPVYGRQIAHLALYAMCFGIFVQGLAAWLRARGKTPLAARLLAVGVVFLLAAGPWAVAAMAGAFGPGAGAEGMLKLAAPSPLFLGVVFDALENLYVVDPWPIERVSIASALVYAVAGLGLVALAALRSRRVRQEHVAIQEETDARLAREDELRAEAPHAESAHANDEPDAAEPSPANST